MKPNLAQRRKPASRRTERENFIVVEVGKLISNGQLPAARYEDYISEALKDESVLEKWRALPPNLPGVPPLNLPPVKIMDENQQAVHDKKTNKAFDKFFPHDWWNNSFFDKGVQIVLDEIRPDREQGETPPDEALALPIRAWKVCDNAVLMQMRPPNAGELIDFLRDMGSWGSRLLAATQLYYETGGRRMRDPKTLGDLFRKWADSRYFESTSLIRPQDPPWKYGEAVAEIQRAFQAVIEQNNLSVTDNALRKYLHDENSRRESIMQHWETNWEAYKRCVIDKLMGQSVGAEGEKSESSGK